MKPILRHTSITGVLALAAMALAFPQSVSATQSMQVAGVYANSEGPYEQREGQRNLGPDLPARTVDGDAAGLKKNSDAYVEIPRRTRSDRREGRMEIDRGFERPDVVGKAPAADGKRSPYVDIPKRTESAKQEGRKEHRKAY